MDERIYRVTKNVRSLQERGDLLSDEEGLRVACGQSGLQEGEHG